MQTSALPLGYGAKLTEGTTRPSGTSTRVRSRGGGTTGVILNPMSLQGPQRFSHLHQHTDYSLLDGAARIKDLISWVKEVSPTARPSP